MIAEEEWEDVKRQFPVNSIFQGRVIHIADFGVFVTIEGCAALGLLEVVEFADDRSFNLEEYPQVGDPVTAIVVHHNDRNRQVCLSTKESLMKRATI